MSHSFKHRYERLRAAVLAERAARKVGGDQLRAAVAEVTAALGGPLSIDNTDEGSE